MINQGEKYFFLETSSHKHQNFLDRDIWMGAMFWCVFQPYGQKKNGWIGYKHIRRGYNACQSLWISWRDFQIQILIHGGQFVGI